MEEDEVGKYVATQKAVLEKFRFLSLSCEILTKAVCVCGGCVS